jgi:hypothetical protein
MFMPDARAKGLLQLRSTALTRHEVLREGVAIPKNFPPEFKRDVVTAPRRGDLTVPEVAGDFESRRSPCVAG